jgi:hypothetical protein
MQVRRDTTAKQTNGTITTTGTTALPFCAAFRALRGPDIRTRIDFAKESPRRHNTASILRFNFWLGILQYSRGVSGEILLLQLNYVPDRKVRRVWTPLKFHCEIGRVVLLFGADFRRRKQRSATSADDLSSTKRSIAVSSCK